MANVIQSAISSIRRKADEILNDNQGWFRGGQFTPIKQTQDINNNFWLGSPGQSLVKVQKTIENPQLSQNIGNWFRNTANTQAPAFQSPVTQNIIKGAGNLAGNFTQAFTGGIQQAGLNIPKMNQGTISDRLGSVAKTGMGISKVASVLTPAFNVANTVSALPQMGDKDVARRLATGVMSGQTGMNLGTNVKSQETNLGPLGKVDLVKTLGGFYGFTKNPLWQKINPVTGLVNQAKVLNNPTLNYLVTRGLKGGVEGMIQGFGDLPDNLTEKQKADFVMKNLLQGAGSEIVMDKSIDLLGKGWNRVINGPETQKVLAGTFDNLKRFHNTAGRYAKYPGATESEAQFLERFDSIDLSQHSKADIKKAREISQHVNYDNIIQPGLSIRKISNSERLKQPTISTDQPIKTGGDYLYHGTNDTVLENITKEGLKPGRRGQLSLSKTEEYAKNFSRDGMTPTGKTNGIVLRVKSGDLEGKTTLIRADGKNRPMSDQLNEILTKETIPPESLEIFKNGKWQNLKTGGDELVNEARKYKSSAEFVSDKIFNSSLSGKDTAYIENNFKGKTFADKLTNFYNKNLSPESKGIKTDLETKLPEQKLPWEEPEYVAKNNGLKTKDSPILKTGTLKQELNQLQTKAPLKSQPIISPELKADIQKGSLSKKVNLIDWFRTPDRVLTKIGLGNEAKQIRTSYNKYLDELPVEISKVTKWYDQVKSSPDASKRLFQYLDGQDVQLNKTELKVAGEIKNYLNEWANKLNLPEDKRVTNYITHIFEKDFIKKEFDEDLAKIISEKVPGSVYDPFTQERLGKTGYVEDVFRALDAYVKRGVRKVNMDPALEKLSSASDKLPLESWKYVKSFADRVNLRPTQIDTYIDDLVKQSPIGYKLGQRPVTATTRKLRQMVYRGTLGLNVGSALRNLTQGVNTYAKLGEKYTAIGYMRNLKEMASGGDELKRVGVLRDDLIQDRQLSAVKGVMEKLDKGLFVFFNLAEKINRGSAYFGAKSKYLNEGFSEKEAIEKAVDLVRKTQFTFGSVDTPVAMQSDIAKTLGQFQSFNMKQAEFLGEMIGGKDIAGMLRWVAGNALIMFTVGQLIGIDLKDIIPFGGVFTGETKLGQTPPIQLGTDIYNAAINAPDKYGNTSEDNVLKRVSGAVVKNLPAWIPAGVQAKKTFQGIKAVNEEGSFSKSGRLQYPIEKTTGNYIRAGLFGKSNLPAAKEYFDNNGQVLGEKQTELYKQSTDKQGVYKQIQEERKTTNELETQKKEFENNGIQSKQVGDKILYLNENNNVSTIDLKKMDDIASLPSDNKYNSAIKESKQYSEAAKIIDNTALTQEQQQTALDRLGIDKDRASYYRIANDSDNLKTMFVLDAVNNVKTQGGGLSDVISLLANQRTEVNGKMIASNGVLDNLVDEGILTKSQATQLKKYKFENGQLVPKSKTGTKAKKVSVTLRKMSTPKLSSSKIKKISVPKKTYKKLKVRKLRTVGK